jgi:hypothetical protein
MVETLGGTGRFINRIVEFMSSNEYLLGKEVTISYIYKVTFDLQCSSRLLFSLTPTDKPACA